MSDNARSAEWYRNTYRDISTSGIVATGTAGAANLILCPTNHTIYIQKVTFMSKTSAAQTVIFQDDSTTNVALHVEASVTAGLFRTIDYGARGFALTAGEGLDIVGTAGPAYLYVIEGYARQTSAVASTTINRYI